ncbi:MAG: RNA polymerase sigma factor [Candidatus Andeanibacterium colombiense]|uniref:RNA polymerase sigma factor n=1 Tax=Candidatus Andeanibacterium colombiense TaxID=3121345 RepID=A0AAJ5X249_9SPHN|nr:MAG: RNA polymerase sigma factor [Sphingomonadaceae bacterium]
MRRDGKVIALGGRPEGSVSAHAPAAPSETRSESLGQAYVRCYREMWRFLAARTGSRDAADELIQEVWLRIAGRADDSSIDNPDAWLQRLVINQSLTWLRRNRFRTIAYEPLDKAASVADEAPDAETIAADRQRHDVLCALVDEMPPRRRAVFVLYRGRGLSLQEVADHLGISIKTVKAQMSEAIAFLRQRMTESGLWP